MNMVIIFMMSAKMTTPGLFKYDKLTQTILKMWPCDQSLITLITSILQGFDQKRLFWRQCYWFKFNNLELALVKALKFYTSVVKGLVKGFKLKVRKFRGLIPKFFRSCRGKTDMADCLSHILNKVLTYCCFNTI